MPQESMSYDDWLKKFSLKAAGYAYLVGDAALFASGVMSGRGKEAATGLIYTFGGGVLARYGRPDAEHQMKELSHSLSDFFTREGIAIPKDSELSAAKLEKEGVLDGVERFLYRYPSQVLNATYAFGGAQLLRSGMQHGKHWDTASGALVAAGGLAGVLIPQKKPSEKKEEQPKTMLEKAWSWIQEKPLRASGYLYMANNATLTMSAIEEMRANPAQKSYWFKFLTAASYVVANGLLAISSKDHTDAGDDAKGARARIEEAAARVIAAQPPAAQADLLQRVAGFLSAQPEVKATPRELQAELADRVVKLAPDAGLWQAQAQHRPELSRQL